MITPALTFTTVGEELRRAVVWEDVVARVLPPARFRHAMGAAALASELARRFDHAEEALVTRAALIHDIGRGFPTAFLGQVEEWFGWRPDDEEVTAGAALLHGPAGGAVATAAGLPEWAAAAVRYHVTGRPQLTLADKIVMAADAAEASRRYPWAMTAREILDWSLDVAVAFWLRLKAAAVEREGRSVHTRSKEAFASFPAEVRAEAERLVYKMRLRGVI